MCTEGGMRKRPLLTMLLADCECVVPDASSTTSTMSDLNVDPPHHGLLDDVFLELGLGFVPRSVYRYAAREESANERFSRRIFRASAYLHKSAILLNLVGQRRCLCPEQPQYRNVPKRIDKFCKIGLTVARWKPDWSNERE